MEYWKYRRQFCLLFDNIMIVLKCLKRHSYNNIFTWSLGFDLFNEGVRWRKSRGRDWPERAHYNIPLIFRYIWKISFKKVQKCTAKIGWQYGDLLLKKSDFENLNNNKTESQVLISIFIIFWFFSQQPCESEYTHWKIKYFNYFIFSFWELHTWASSLHYSHSWAPRFPSMSPPQLPSKIYELFFIIVASIPLSLYN